MPEYSRIPAIAILDIRFVNFHLLVIIAFVHPDLKHEL